MKSIRLVDVDLKIVAPLADPSIGCSKTNRHTKPAYEKMYGETVFVLINAECANEEEIERKASIIRVAEYKKRMAESEATKRGLEYKGESFERPCGVAPEKMTWSYFTGKWVPC